MHTNHLKSAFEALGASEDLVSIKSALYLICSEFGVVRRLDVLLGRQGGKRQALFFLRMENAEHEQQIMRVLEVARFAGDLVMVVDLPLEAPAPRMNAAQPLAALGMA